MFVINSLKKAFLHNIAGGFGKFGAAVFTVILCDVYFLLICLKISAVKAGIKPESI